MNHLFTRRMVCLAVLLGVALSAAGLLAPATGGKPDKPDPTPTRHPPRYTITWLQPPPETTFINVAGINDLGHVVGRLRVTLTMPDGTTKAVSHPYVWTNDSGTVDLNDLLPYSSPWDLREASDINIRGQIVGNGYVVDESGNRNYRAFRFTPGNPPIIEDLGTWGGPLLSSTVASGINDHGDVTGAAQDADGIFHAFVCGGAPEELTPMVPIDVGQPNVHQSWGNAINMDGQVAGKFEVVIDNYGTTIKYGFLFTPGAGMKKLALQEPNYMDRSDAKDINDSGQVVGWGFPSKGPGQRNAFRYTDGVGVVDLGVIPVPGYTDKFIISDAAGINCNGDVVGISGFNSGYRGFIYIGDPGQPGKMFALDDFVDLMPDDALLWASTYVDALKINANGQICGSASGPMGYFPFVLTPSAAP